MFPADFFVFPVDPFYIWESEGVLNFVQERLRLKH